MRSQSCKKLHLKYLRFSLTLTPCVGYLDLMMKRLGKVFSILLSVTVLVISCSLTSYHRDIPPRSNRQVQAKLNDYAKTFLGTPYRYGGISKSGIDCSGLIVRVYKDICGISLPHSTKSLFNQGSTLSIRSLEIGDLVFFRDERGLSPSHVGMYIGKGRFIHSEGGRGVIITKMNNRYYKQRFAGARRLLSCK